ncbi:MAG: multicopper oxidase domain-containing protein [Chloroflexota bacterium]|nr:multicopper oxidase domain-containing protein [Chloroflexota bacterium]
MEWVKDRFLVGPAERVDLALAADNPRAWMLNCHIKHHMANGMTPVLMPCRPESQERSSLLKKGRACRSVTGGDCGRYVRSLPPGAPHALIPSSSSS